MKLDLLFLAFHVTGALMWIGSLFAVVSFLEATIGEPDPAAKARLMKHLRAAAIVPDIGFTIALVFGAHWLFRFKLYEAHYMDIKLVLVACVVGLHIWLRRKVGALKRGEQVTAPPAALKPMMTLTALSIVIFVITKVPA